MNKQDIMKILPHRDNMLLIDEVRVESGMAIGSKKIVGNEWFLDGHFPGNPVVPGVILCEILAQSACVFLADQAENNKTPYFTGLDKVKFKKRVLPGDVVETRCQIVRSKGSFYFGKGKGLVGGEVCIEAEFSFALV